jgi:hypothetical protein
MESFLPSQVDLDAFLKRSPLGNPEKEEKIAFLVRFLQKIDKWEFDKALYVHVYMFDEQHSPELILNPLVEEYYLNLYRTTYKADYELFSLLEDFIIPS